MFDIFKIYRIAKNNPDGFTFDLETKELVTSGIIVAYEATQNSFGILGLLKCWSHAKENGNVVGGWGTGNGLQFDSCRVFKDRKTAIEFGRLNNQIAIFDLDELEEIRL